MFKLIDSVNLPLFIVLSLFLGMAPFFPEPHIVQKINMLIAGELNKPLDLFDLVLHGTPWILLLIKLSRLLKSSQVTSN